MSNNEQKPTQPDTSSQPTLYWHDYETTKANN